MVDSQQGLVHRCRIRLRRGHIVTMMWARSFTPGVQADVCRWRRNVTLTMAARTKLSTARAIADDTVEEDTVR